MRAIETADAASVARLVRAAVFVVVQLHPEYCRVDVFALSVWGEQVAVGLVRAPAVRFLRETDSLSLMRSGLWLVHSLCMEGLTAVGSVCRWFRCNVYCWDCDILGSLRPCSAICQQHRLVVLNLRSSIVRDDHGAGFALFNNSSGSRGDWLRKPAHRRRRLSVVNKRCGEGSTLAQQRAEHELTFLRDSLSRNANINTRTQTHSNTLTHTATH